MRTLPLFLLAVASLPAQPIQIFSEFQRPSPFGEIVPADRTAAPREILSPLLPRNGFTIFHIAITPPKGEWFTLHIAQNPENAVKVQLYKELFTKVGDAWVPDRVEPVSLPLQGRLPDQEIVPGQTTVALLLEIWVAPDAPVRRTRLEAQYNVGDNWIISPLELRISTPVVPNQTAKPSLPVAPSQRADTSALARARQYVCSGVTAGGAPLNPASLAFFYDRSALQDVAIARSMRDETARISMIGDILRSAGVQSSKAWCDAKSAPDNPEWYLRFRDQLLRGGD